MKQGELRKDTNETRERVGGYEVPACGLTGGQRYQTLHVPPRGAELLPNPFRTFPCGLTTEARVSFCGHHTGAAYA
jgi:hypothetical protein